MTPASTSQRAVAAAVEHKEDTSQQCTVATSSIVQGTKKPPLHYLTFARIMALLALPSTRMPPVRFSGPCTPRDTGMLFVLGIFAPEIPMNICHAGQRLSSKLSRCHPYGRVRKKLSIRWRKVVPHKNPLVVLLSTSVCRPSSGHDHCTFTFYFHFCFCFYHAPTEVVHPASSLPALFAVRR